MSKFKHKMATQPQPTPTPNCPKCGDSKQVWRNQISGRMTCHRAYCHTEIESEADNA